MKKKKNYSKRISILIAVFITLLCLSVSIRYYKNVNGNYNTMEYALLVFENTIKSYFAQSPLKISDVASVKLSENELVDKVLVFLYSVAILIAPFFTLTKVLETSRNIKLAIKTFAFKFFFKKKNDNVLVFSYNKFVKAFLENEIKNDRKIIVITKQKVDIEEKLYYIDNDVWIIDETLLNNSEEKEKKQFIKLIDKIKYIVFLNENEVNNYTHLNDFYSNLVEANIDTKNKKMIYCYAEEYQTKAMINDFLYDATVKLDKDSKEKKYENGIIEDYKVFDLSSLRARKFLCENKVVTNIEKSDIHNVIIGFGRLGHAFFDYILNGSVYNQNGSIRIDVIGNDIDIEKNYVLNRISERYFTKIDDYHISLPGLEESDKTKCDGKLDIYFHNLSIEDRSFYDELLEIDRESKSGIDNIYICTRKDSITISALNTIKKVLDRHSDFGSNDLRLYLRMETNSNLPILNDEKLMEVLNSSINSRIDKIPIITSESEVLKIDIIEDEENTNMAIIYNYIYGKLYDAVYDILNSKSESKFFDISSISKLKDNLSESYNKEWLKAKNDWRTNVFYNRQSTWFLVMHNAVKKTILETKENKDKNFIVNLKEELKECLSSSFKDEEQLRKFIKDNDKSILFDFIKIEHRRWNYFTGFGGFCYDVHKNKQKYKHDCLLSYEELVNKKIDTVLYDLLPLNYLLFYDAKYDTI